MEYGEGYLQAIVPVTVPDAEHVALAHSYLDRNSDLRSTDPDFSWMRAGGVEHCPAAAARWTPRPRSRACRKHAAGGNGLTTG